MPKIWNRRRELPGAWYMKRIAMVRKSYLANFRAIWNTEQFSELLGIVAVMIPVDAVRDSMNGMMDQQTLYLLDENDTILLSGGSQKYRRNVCQN